ncbi:hypothetical protein DUNSADRAFT_7242 [Dunaliella salina]|uniref:J domain-containing protein n=1 Tax=Dunaliella salina TaxID=3046 RepID=A0ABQ7GLV6_DUNSA|nr:hypothetical protein DUNSADRAFT_7242 [Dunaliella salina]|eukprot:KAF5835543.1 hypothetical protein DUNSADRAFT_7242 [Dunaliella salina]
MQSCKAGEKSQQKFIELQQAYETLSDPAKKREYDLGFTYGRSGGGYQRRQSNFHSGFGNAYTGFGQQRRTFYDTTFDEILPSETTLLTSINMRQLIFYGSTPWLIQVYAEDSPACRAFSSTWESLNKAMFSGTPGKPWVSLGRINWRHQRNLAGWLSNAHFTGGDIAWTQLPVIYGVPKGCMDPRCFVRFFGPVTLPALQEFAAAKLLKLPPVPSVSTATLAVLMQRVHPSKVIALAFSKSESQGSIPLRTLALKHRDMMHFARVAIVGAGNNQKGGPDAGSLEEQQQQQEAAAAMLQEWSQQLGVKVSVPSLVLLRGPGAVPEVLTMKPGEVQGYEETIHARGLMWQTIPALRPYTIEHLGCKWWDGRRQSAYSRRGDPAKLCVVVVGRGRMEQARSNAHQLSQLLAALSTPESRIHQPAAAAAAASASAALMASQLRVVWLDANTQHAFCVHHFQGFDDDVMNAVCGSGGWSTALANAGHALLAQDFSAALRALVSPNRKPQTAMVAYVPTPTPSTRGKEAPLHLFSTFTEVTGCAHLACFA